MHKYLILFILTSLTLLSCETQLPEGEWSKTPTPSVTYQLSVSKTTISSGSDGSSDTFSITSDDSWTISTSDSWLKVSDASGTGDKSITVTLDPEDDAVRTS